MRISDWSSDVCSSDLPARLSRLRQWLRQFLLQDLAIGVEGHRIDDEERARHLVVGKMLAAEGDDLVGLGALPGAQRDRSGDILAQNLVLHADHRRLLHRRMEMEDRKSTRLNSSH